LTEVTVGVIGAGLMGQELASSIGRWMALSDASLIPRITAVCDLSSERRLWFERLGTMEISTDDYRQVLESDVDVVYIAVPHDLHAEMYTATARAGKAFLGEKPFGFDLGATKAIVSAIDESDVFARCSSEIPFFPGAQEAIRTVMQGELGTILDARYAFLHSSDLNRSKPINWKRRVETCGPGGVMSDLGMHVFHVPLRLGWGIEVLAAHLQDIVHERPDGEGGVVECDTIDNATIFAEGTAGGSQFPIVFETKRIAPGETNTWLMTIIGTEGGVSFSTKYPKSLRRFEMRAGRQVWSVEDLGSVSAHPTITGAIFESGFADAVQQMWASFFAELGGDLAGRFACATPSEALDAQRIIDDALRVGVSRS
jgi:predicted dehydrogenase